MYTCHLPLGGPEINELIQEKQKISYVLSILSFCMVYDSMPSVSFPWSNDVPQKKKKNEKKEKKKKKRK